MPAKTQTHFVFVHQKLPRQNFWQLRTPTQRRMQDAHSVPGCKTVARSHFYYKDYDQKKPPRHGFGNVKVSPAAGGCQNKFNRLNVTFSAGRQPTAVVITVTIAM